MRSVLVFPTADVDRLVGLLDSLGQRSADEWFGIANRGLEISLEDHGSAEALVRALRREGSWSTSELRTLWRVRDELGGCRVDVRVSGRIDGQAEMRWMVDLLLADGGYATDDYSDRVWSLAEIQQSAQTSAPFRA